MSVDMAPLTEWYIVTEVCSDLWGHLPDGELFVDLFFVDISRLQPKHVICFPHGQKEDTEIQNLPDFP